VALKTNTVVTRVDDIDGSTGDDVKTHRFTLDVELELSAANYQTVRAQLDALVKAGRKPGERRTRRTRKVTAAH
jgi:hypothetical protein